MKRRQTTLECESSDELPQDLFFRSAAASLSRSPSVPDAEIAESAPVRKTMVCNCIGISLLSALLTAVIFMILSNQAAVEERVLYEETVAQVQRTVDIQQRQSTGSGPPAHSELIDDSALLAWQPSRCSNGW